MIAVRAHGSLHRDRFSSALTCGEPWPFRAAKLGLPSVLAHGTRTRSNGLSVPVEEDLWDSSTCRRQNPLHQPLRLGDRAAPNVEPVRPSRALSKFAPASST
jgi:hypothetical protein